MGQWNSNRVNVKACKASKPRKSSGGDEAIQSGG